MAAIAESAVGIAVEAYGRDGVVIANAFGVALRHARERAGLSQEALALKAEVDRTFVSRSERGERRSFY